MFRAIGNGILGICTKSEIQGKPAICSITKTSLFKYSENFTTKKGKFSDILKT